MFFMPLPALRSSAFAASALALALGLAGCGSGDASYNNPQQQPPSVAPAIPTMTISSSIVYENDPITFNVTAPDRPDVTVIEASFDGGQSFQLINELGQNALTISFAYSGKYGTRLLDSGGTIHVRSRVLNSVGAETIITILCLDITGEGLIAGKLSELQNEKHIGNLRLPTSNVGHAGGQQFPGHFDIDFSMKASGKKVNYFYALDYNARNGAISDPNVTDPETTNEVSTKDSDWESLSSINVYTSFPAMTWEELTSSIDAYCDAIRALPTP